MGGALTLAAMADGAAIDAGAPFYGESCIYFGDNTKEDAESQMCSNPWSL